MHPVPNYEWTQSFSKKNFADACDDLKSPLIDILTGHVGTLDPTSSQFISEMPTYVMENLANSKMKTF